VVNLGVSSQSVTFTGTGKNASGAGTSIVSWGSCSFDGTTTTCVVSGSYTGLGNGGAYAFTLAYGGNGPSPLTTTANPPGSDTVSFNLSAGSFTFTLTPTGGSPVNFYDLYFGLFFSPLTDTCTGVTTCSVGAVGVTNGGTIKGPVSGTFDATPVISPNGVVSATSYGGFSAIAPATWIEIYGINLATILSQTWAGSDFNGVQAPAALGGTKVTVASKPAYIDFVSPHQVNVQVPSGIAAGLQPVVVTTFGGSSVGFNITVNAVEPGILAPPVFNLGGRQYVVALFPDGRTYVLPPGTTSSVATARAKPGDTIMLYGIGFGPVAPDISAGLVVNQTNALSGFQAAFAGAPATVNFAGLVQGFLGLYQFNVVVPNVPANDATPFTFTLNGKPGIQNLVVAVGN
jgi:uncharacterized protein (TIGR03437 family)